MARYSHGRGAAAVVVRVRYLDGTERDLEVRPFLPDEIPRGWLL